MLQPSTPLRAEGPQGNHTNHSLRDLHLELTSASWLALTSPGLSFPIIKWRWWLQLACRLGLEKENGPRWVNCHMHYSEWEWVMSDYNVEVASLTFTHFSLI